MRVVYYAALAVITLWGILALRLTQPIILLSLSANMAGIVFIISSLHVLYVNTHLLPKNCDRRSGAVLRSLRSRFSTGFS